MCYRIVYDLLIDIPISYFILHDIFISSVEKYNFETSTSKSDQFIRQRIIK